MRKRSRRGVVGAATALGVVLAVGAAAWACVPGPADTTSFNVTPAGGGTYRTGTVMTATGTLERANWPYHIKLRQGEYDGVNKKSDCGDFGAQQTVAMTNGAKYLNTTFPLDTLGQAPPVGSVDAFFCALPSPNKWGTAVLNTDPVRPTIGPTDYMYIDTWEAKITIV
jgi:hypothetical protein